MILRWTGSFVVSCLVISFLVALVVGSWLQREPLMSETTGNVGPNVPDLKLAGGVWGSYATKFQRLERIEAAANALVDVWDDLNNFTANQQSDAREALREALGRPRG